MFRRRIKLTLRRRVRNFVWPRMGWWRWLRYAVHRVGRLPHTPYAIAAGLACGAAFSMTPFMGLHFLLGAGLAWVMRASIIAAAAGTALGNPWTFPLIWALTYRLGRLVIGPPTTEAAPGEPARLEISLSTLMEQPHELLLPMAIGGLICLPVVWLAVFVPCYYLIERYQSLRRRRLRRKQLRVEGEQLRTATAEGETGGTRDG